MTWRLGIDPGLTGALALVDDDGKLHALWDMPIGTRGSKNEVDAKQLGKIIRQAKRFAGKHGLRAYLEWVGGRPAQQGGFSFGDSFGVVRGVLVSLNVEIVLVAPLLWKARFGLVKKEKDEARSVVKQYFSDVVHDIFKRKADIGRAEAALIALAFGAGKQEAV